MTLMERLAELIRARSDSSRDILGLAVHPATRGRLREFIAALVLDIHLAPSASRNAFRGHFRSGPLAGRAVELNSYSRDEGVLRIGAKALPDEYLVCMGPLCAQLRGEDRAWSIERMFLLDARALVDGLRKRGAKVGAAASPLRSEWDEAEIYPDARNAMLVLDEEQRRLLGLFSPNQGDAGA